MRRVRLSVATALATSLLLAGCGGGEESPEPAASGSPTPTSPQAAPATEPLTGQPVAAGVDPAREHPVFVVKIDNTGNAAPQVGLGKADLVVEELVEGGLTRLAAFFYSELPGKVGPVRSMRSSDIGIVSPVGGQLVTSGAAPQTYGRLDKAGVKFHGEGAPGVGRDSSRSAPYNVMANLGDLAKAVKVDATRPADYLPWGDAADFPKGRKATKLTASFGGRSTTWEFKGGRWISPDSYAGKGDAFEPETVLVLKVRIGDAGYTDMAGNPVPETEFEGKGDALVFRDGQVVKAQWSKDELASPLTLATKAGELRLPPGKVFIELVPVDRGGVTY